MFLSFSQNKQFLSPGLWEILLVIFTIFLHFMINQWIEKMINRKELLVAALVHIHKLLVVVVFLWIWFLFLLRTADFGLARMYGIPQQPMTPRVVTLWWVSTRPVGHIYRKCPFSLILFMFLWGWVCCTLQISCACAASVETLPFNLSQ